ncbi:SMI1/KNR4 family protein [Kitasatospora sp. NPDC052868]|uniref:SMI1/KNR4 family protein n=1 Tax=Kitasatospora sp. NPDC052868 TaxID=3364060 RepID=UPI0037C74D17
MVDHLDEVQAVIGLPSGPGASDESWRELEAELGVELPGDFKELTGLYAPIRIGYSIMLSNPATTACNLGVYMRETVVAYEDCEFSEENFPGFREPLGFGAPDGLIPVLSTAHGESVFLARTDTRYGWCIVVYVGADDEFYRYDLTFAEWFRRYLQGEDMAGPNSGQDFPNPIVLTDLHVPSGEKPVERFGPVRPS